jgi:hypothetical protein
MTRKHSTPSIQGFLQQLRMINFLNEISKKDMEEMALVDYTWLEKPVFDEGGKPKLKISYGDLICVGLRLNKHVLIDFSRRNGGYTHKVIGCYENEAKTLIELLAIGIQDNIPVIVTIKS